MASKSFPAGPGRRRPISDRDASLIPTDVSSFYLKHQITSPTPASESRSCTLPRSRYPAPTFISNSTIVPRGAAAGAGLAALFGDWTNSLPAKDSVDKSQSDDVESLNDNDTAENLDRNPIEAKNERLILDLEICNNSLLAINASLESQLAKAKAYTDHLEKQLQFLMNKGDSREEESDISESEAEVIMESDPDFKRVRNIIDGMRTELAEAVSSPFTTHKDHRVNKEHKGELFGDTEVSRIRQIFHEMTQMTRPASADRESFTVPSSPIPEAPRLGAYTLARSSSHRSSLRLGAQTKKPPNVNVLLDELHGIIFSKERKKEPKATFIGGHEPEEPLPSAKMSSAKSLGRQNDMNFVHAPIPQRNLSQFGTARKMYSNSS